MSWDIIGQERAVAALRRAIEDEARLSHAYLFVGPEQVGRAMTARRFAQALNCVHNAPSSFPPARPERLLDLGDTPSAPLRAGPRPPAKGRSPSALPLEAESQQPAAQAEPVPCGACRSCRLIAEDKHPDVEWVGPGGICEEPEHRDHSADGSRDIRICQVRRLERVVSRAPFEGRYRVLIVDPADALTVEAANAFLKTLEEPAPNVVLILISAREEALPETVRSRCRRIAFFGVPRAALEEALVERWDADAAQASRLARLAQGRLGWAVAALQDERLLIDRERTMDEIESLVSGGYEERFSYAASLGARFSRDPQTVRTNLDVWRAWWRDVLLAAAGQEQLASAGERLDTLRSHASQYGVRGAVQALTAVMNGRRHLEEHASPTLALEVMLLELPPAAAS